MKLSMNIRGVQTIVNVTNCFEEFNLCLSSPIYSVQTYKVITSKMKENLKEDLKRFKKCSDLRFRDISEAFGKKLIEYPDCGYSYVLESPVFKVDNPTTDQRLDLLERVQQLGIKSGEEMHSLKRSYERG
jgi:hypothetical protein